MKYILLYETNQEFHDDQMERAGKDVQPGECVWDPIPGVSYTVESEITDYNPIPKDVPTLIFVNETNQDSEVYLVARDFGTGTTYFNNLPNRPKVVVEYSNNNKYFRSSASTDNPDVDQTLGPFPLPANGRLYLRGNNDTFAVGNIVHDNNHKYSLEVSLKYWSFRCNVRHRLEGNLMALLNDDTGVTEDFELAGLFDGDDMLREVADTVLSSQVIPTGAYLRLFCQSENTEYGLERMPKIDAEVVEDWGCLETFMNAHFETVTELPATELGMGAYYKMFANSKHITGMTHALPNATANWYTWASMFADCTELREVKPLEQENAYPRSMMHMFAGCTSLVEPPVMSLRTMTGLGDSNEANECCGYMFQGCTALSATPTFFSNLVYPIKEGFTSLFSYYIFQYMFRGCKSLKKADFTISAQRVYPFALCQMFSGCTNLEVPPSLPNVYWANQNAMEGMFADCTSLTGAPVLTVTEAGTNCCSQMYAGCTGITAGTLPKEMYANSIGQNAYYGVFSGCTSLSEVTVGFTENTSRVTTYLGSWLDGAAPVGVVKKKSNAQWDSTPGNGIVPAGWTVDIIQNT